MAKRHPVDDERARQLLAQETARIVIDAGVRDYGKAKLKAAERLGLSTRGALPGNKEIDAAIAEHLELFGGDEHHQRQHDLRTLAIDAMELLQPFEPRLVGPVLAGTADENSAINLHVFADSAESVALHLDDRGVRTRLYERNLKHRPGRNSPTTVFSGYQFRFNHEYVEATVFPFDGLRQAPISPIDNRPMRRADRKDVEALLADAG
ncbi:MAG: hypothetical protein AAF351_00405 [Pseudomonadota bacterium]